MRRRRLIVVVAVLTPLAAAGWLTLDRLSGQERALVGTWQAGPDPAGQWASCSFGADRRFVYVASLPGGGGTGFSGRWSFRGGVVTLDPQANPIRRAIRPVWSALGKRLYSLRTFAAEAISPDRVVMTPPGGQPQVYTRAPAD
jgi:hypothetical protein